MVETCFCSDKSAETKTPRRRALSAGITVNEPILTARSDEVSDLSRELVPVHKSLVLSEFSFSRVAGDVSFFSLVFAA